MHFETKLVVFLINLKMDELKFSGDAVAHYLLDMYSSDEGMQEALMRYFAAAPFVCFDKITDRSIISSMNNVQTRWAWDGYHFYDYIKDGILHTKQINRDVNKMPVTRKVDGKEEWFIPYDLFAKTIKKHFAWDNTTVGTVVSTVVLFFLLSAKETEYIQERPKLW